MCNLSFQGPRNFLRYLETPLIAMIPGKKNHWHVMMMHRYHPIFARLYQQAKRIFCGFSLFYDLEGQVWNVSKAIKNLSIEFMDIKEFWENSKAWILKQHRRVRLNPLNRINGRKIPTVKTLNSNPSYRDLKHANKCQKFFTIFSQNHRISN